MGKREGWKGGSRDTPGYEKTSREAGDGREGGSFFDRGIRESFFVVTIKSET